jgi:hypothetical protein
MEGDSDELHPTSDDKTSLKVFCNRVFCIVVNIDNIWNSIINERDAHFVPRLGSTPKLRLELGYNVENAMALCKGASYRRISVRIFHRKAHCCTHLN